MAQATSTEVDPFVRTTGTGIPRPYPLRRGIDVADDRLAAFGDVDVLHGHLLLAP